MQDSYIYWWIRCFIHNLSLSIEIWINCKLYVPFLCLLSKPYSFYTLNNHDVIKYCWKGFILHDCIGEFNTVRLITLTRFQYIKCVFILNKQTWFEWTGVKTIWWQINVKQLPEIIQSEYIFIVYSLCLIKVLFFAHINMFNRRRRPRIFVFYFDWMVKVYLDITLWKKYLLYSVRVFTSGNVIIWPKLVISVISAAHSLTLVNKKLVNFTSKKIHYYLKSLKELPEKMPKKTDSPQIQPGNSLLEIQIQEELDKNLSNFESEMESTMDTLTHRQNMRNFFDSVCWIFDTKKKELLKKNL